MSDGEEVRSGGLGGFSGRVACPEVSVDPPFSQNCGVLALLGFM